MAGILSDWVEIALILRVCWMAWLNHVDRRNVLGKGLEKAKSADEVVKLFEAWAPLERSTLADLLRKRK